MDMATIAAPNYIADELPLELDPLAQRIVERAVKDPKILTGLPSGLTADQEWVRGLLIEYFQRTGFLREEQDDIFLARFPDQFLDPEVRRLAGMGPLSPEFSGTLRKPDQDFGLTPDIDRYPVAAKLEGQCDACGERSRIESVVRVIFHGIGESRVKLCGVCEESRSVLTNPHQTVQRQALYRMARGTLVP
jgi:hypothetical protein